MKRPTSNPRIQNARKWIPLLAGLLVMASAALAQDPEVTAADPPSAEQETYDLEVTISGDNFGTDSEVDFFVTGTEDPGGITVKKVKRRGPKNLVATIDVALEATVDDFDIQVRSRGRTGKGTELFAVREKTNGGGNDTTPPGAVYDLTAGVPSFSTVELTWTATADDGYDPASGPVYSYDYRYRRDGPVTDENWDTSFYAAPGFSTEPKEPPGMPQSVILENFEPETTYHVGIQVWDAETYDGGNISSVSNPVSFTTAAFPASPWSVDEIANEIDDCEFAATGRTLAYDPAGWPVVGYRCDSGSRGVGTPVVARWDGTGWQKEYHDPDPGGDVTFTFDPISGELTFTQGLNGVSFVSGEGSAWTEEVIERNKARGPGALEYWDGAPVVAYRKEGKGKTSCRLARRVGSAWEKEVIDPDTLCTKPQLAFDALGDPAVIYLDDLDTGNPGGDLLKVAVWDGTAWSVETVAQPGGLWKPGSPAIAYDPIRNDFSIAYDTHIWGTGYSPDGYELRFCDRTGGSWSCELVDEVQNLWGISLAFDASGTAYLAYDANQVPTLATRPYGASSWASEVVAPRGRISMVKLDATGAPGILFKISDYETETSSLSLARRSTP